MFAETMNHTLQNVINRNVNSLISKAIDTHVV